MRTGLLQIILVALVAFWASPTRCEDPQGTLDDATSSSPTTTLKAYGKLFVEDYVPDSARKGVIDVGSSGTADGVYAVLSNGSVVLWGHNEFYDWVANVSRVLRKDVPITKMGVTTEFAWAVLGNGTWVAWDQNGFIPAYTQHNVTDAITRWDGWCMLLFKTGTIAGAPHDAVDILQSIQGQVQSMSPVTLSYESGGWLAAEVILVLLKNGSVTLLWDLNDNDASSLLIPDFSGLDVVEIQGGKCQFAVRLKNHTVLYWSCTNHQVDPAAYGQDGPLAVQNMEAVGCQPEYDNAFYAYRCKQGYLLALPDHGNITSVAVSDDFVYLTNDLGNVYVYFVDAGFTFAQDNIVPASAAASVVKVSPTPAYAVFLLTAGVVVAKGAIYTDMYVPSALQKSAVQIAAGSNHVMVLTKEGQVFAYGGNTAGELEVPPQAQSRCISITAGLYHSVAITSSRSVVEWGSSNERRVSVPNITHFNTAQIAAGEDRSYALLRDTGKVVGWGPDTEAEKPPTANVSQIASSSFATLALFKNSTVVAWRGAKYYDVPAAAKSGVASVYMNVWHAVAVKANGSVIIWQVTPDGPVTDLITINKFPTARKAIVCEIDIYRYFYILLRNGTLMHVGPLDGLGNPETETWKQYQSETASEASSTVLDVTCGKYFRLVLLQDKQAPDVAVARPVPPARPPIQETATERSAVGGVVTTSSGGQAASDLVSNAGEKSDVKRASLSSGAIIGATIACIAGLLILAAAAALFVRRSLKARRHKHEHKSSQAVDAVGSAESNFNWGVRGAGDQEGMVVLELEGKQQQGSDEGQSRLSAADTANVSPSDLHVPGLQDGEVFMRATALSYAWGVTSCKASEVEAIEAGVNDWQLDRKVLQSNAPASGIQGRDQSLLCPVVQLCKEEVSKEIVLLQDGLLGRGATALVFKCQWPSRFGPKAVLAAKVLKDGYEADEALLDSFKYEAELLATALHPNIVRLYGFCLEPPNVCLILELLPYCLKDLLYNPEHSLQTEIPKDFAKQHNAEIPGQPKSKASQTQSIQCIAETVITEDEPLDSSGSSRDSPFITISKSNPKSDNNKGPMTGTGGCSKDASTGNRNSVFTLRTEDSVDSQATVPSAASRLTLRQVLSISRDVSSALAFLHSKHLLSVAGPATDTDSTVVCVDNDSVNKTEQQAAHMLAVSTRIAHRDLKPANVLINSLGVAKISDFGLARQHDNTTIHTLHVAAGTLPYMAPELLVATDCVTPAMPPTNKVDVYSLGMMLWEMLSGQAPWKGTSQAQLVALVVKGVRPGVPSRQSKDALGPVNPSTSATLSSCPELNDIIIQCWQTREYRRPTAAQAHDMIVKVMQEYSQAQAPSTGV